MKTFVVNKKKPIKIDLPMESFVDPKANNPKLIEGAKKVMKDINEHMNKRGHGWPLNFNILVGELFYNAYGHHVEKYLFNELAKSKKYMMNFKDGHFVVAKLKKGKSNGKKKTKKIKKD